MGRSAGSIFAINAVAKLPNSRIKGLILESSIADLPQRFEQRLDGPEFAGQRDSILTELARNFNHQKSIEKLACPLMVMHTVNDHLVPAWHGKKNANWARTEAILFEKGDHNSIQQLNSPQYQLELKNFIQKVSTPAQ